MKLPPCYERPEGNLKQPARDFEEWKQWCESFARMRFPTPAALIADQMEEDMGFGYMGYSHHVQLALFKS